MVTNGLKQFKANIEKSNFRLDPKAEGVWLMNGTKRRRRPSRGDKGKVPDVPGAVTKGVDSMDKANEEFNSSRNDLQTKIKALKTSMTQTVSSLRQFLATMQKSDLGL